MKMNYGVGLAVMVLAGHVCAQEQDQLTYYKSYNTPYQTTEDLLKYGDGDCYAWARFFIDIFKVQGFQEQNNLIAISAVNPNEGFVVKHWTFPSQGKSKFPAYPYMNLPAVPIDPDTPPTATMIGNTNYNWRYVDVTYTEGIPGQGNPKPPSLFHRHLVVSMNGQYYDPSYGLMHTNLLNDFANTMVDGYWIMAKNFPVRESEVNVDLDGDGVITTSVVPTWAVLFRTNSIGAGINIEKTETY